MCAYQTCSRYAGHWDEQHEIAVMERVLMLGTRYLGLLQSSMLSLVSAAIKEIFDIWREPL